MRQLIGLLALTLLLLSTAQPAHAADSDVQIEKRYADYDKDDYINKIIDELKSIYTDNRIIAGKRVKITIKDFSLQDEWTYAFVEAGAENVEGPDDVWIIDLPARPRYRYMGNSYLCVCRRYPPDSLPNDFVAGIKKNGIVKRITVPQPPVPFGFEITGGSIGPIYLGQARDFAVHAYDDHHIKEVSLMVEGMAASALEVYEDDGALLLTAEIYNDRVFRVTTRSAKFKTKQGIGVGSTYAAARREYGPPAYVGQGDAGGEPVYKFQFFSGVFGFAGVGVANSPDDSAPIAVVSVARPPQ